MGEPEMFIVTVVCPNEGVEVDMEIPAVLPVDEMRGKILDVLKNIYEESFSGRKECRLFYENRPLKDEETLLEAGVFDGSRLEVL